MTIHSVAWQEWEIKERIHTLSLIGIPSYTYDENKCTLEIQHCLGSGHTEAVSFICDPTYSIQMWKLDSTLMKIISRLQAKFNYWRCNQLFFDSEEIIAKAIKELIISSSCKLQDKLIQATSEELKEIVISEFKIYEENLSKENNNVVKNVINTFLTQTIHDKSLSWNRIHLLLFPS